MVQHQKNIRMGSMIFKSTTKAALTGITHVSMPAMVNKANHFFVSFSYIDMCLGIYSCMCTRIRCENEDLGQCQLVFVVYILLNMHDRTNSFVVISECVGISLVCYFCPCIEIWCEKKDLGQCQHVQCVNVLKTITRDNG